MENYTNINCVWVVKVLLISSIFHSSHWGVEGQACRLNNQWKTPGECKDFRECEYQKGRFRVGAEVTKCAGPNEYAVCCPTEESLSQKYCKRWFEMLKAPLTFDQEPLEDPLCARVAKQFIVGGRLADDYEYPHAVALGFGEDKNKLNYLCGATLISDQFLLTAAHCVQNRRVGKPTYALIGDNKLDPGEKPSPVRQLVPIVEHISHPNYKPPSIYNDIALLRLAKPLNLERYVLPACLGDPITAAKRKMEVEASGWGAFDVTSASLTSNELRSINISVVDRKACNEHYDNEPDKPFRYPQGLVRSQICATGDVKDTCRGDSGGGLYTRQHSCLFHVVGVTSIGSKLCGEGSPAVYTNVASYQDWIEGIVWPNGEL